MSLIENEEINDFQIKTLQENYQIKFKTIQQYARGVGLYKRFYISYKILKNAKEVDRIAIVDKQQTLYEELNRLFNKNLEALVNIK